MGSRLHQKSHAIGWSALDEEEVCRMQRADAGPPLALLLLLPLPCSCYSPCP